MSWRDGVRRGRTSRRPRVYLHVGAMKTGTTYLQQVLSLNKQALADAGILFPGESWSDQSAGVRQVMRATDQTAPGEHWQRLVEEMLAYRGTASVLSMEFLSFADRKRAARVVDSLSGAEVHVILTARDTRGSIPAQWQTLCRNGSTLPLPRFLRALRRALQAEGVATTPAVRKLRRTQDIARMLEAWGSAVGPKRLHVVTVPPQGSDARVLWERFAQVVGADPRVATRDPGRRNPSMGLPSTELLRRINVELSDLHPADYNEVMRKIARNYLAPRASLEPRVTLGRRGQRLAARWNGTTLRAIVASGAEWVGTPEDLPTAGPQPDAPQAPSKARAEDLLAAAAAARDGLLDLLAALEAGETVQSASRRPPERLRPDAVPSSPSRWAAETDPVRAAVQDLADLVRACAAARRASQPARPLGEAHAEGVRQAP